MTEGADHGATDLFVVPGERRSRTSDIIQTMIVDASDGHVTLRSLTEQLGDRTFGMLLVVLSILNLVPIISIFFGLLICVVGVQMVIGLRRASLPVFIMERALPADSVKQALLAVLPRVVAVERYIRPRWQFTEAPVVDRLNGVIIFLLGALIMVPVPLVNLIPASVVMLMGLGLLERDGVLQVVAIIIGTTTPFVVYLLFF